MSNLFNVLNTGRLGLFAQQAGLAVTGNNIANVNTEGYTRQRAVLESLAAGGVQLRGTQRLQDTFVQARLLGSNSGLGYSATLALNLTQIESALGDGSDSGLGRSLQDFFNALQDLSQKPGGTAEREALRGRTDQLVSAFSSVTNELMQIRRQIDQQVVNDVAKINDLATRIADLNGKLGFTSQENGGVGDPGTNALLDQRDQLIEQLSQLVPVRTISDGRNGSTVFMGDQVLVEGTAARQLSTKVDQSNDGMHNVVLNGPGGGLPLAGRLQSGELAALLQARDQEAGTAQDSIDRLASQLARDFNLQHRLGTGLDNVSGRDFFNGLQAVATPAGRNAGGAVANSAVILNEALLTFNDYEIRFTSAGQYDVVNATTGATLSSGSAYASGGAINFDGLRVTISNDTGAPAAGDVFRVNSYSGMGERIGLAAAVAGDARAIAAGQTSASGDNSNVLQLIALRDQAAMGQPASQTYEAYFDNLRVRQGMATAAAQQAETDQQTANAQLVSMADSLSGVSLDEEATHLIEYQRAFQASSRVISATDELLQTLLQMI